MSDFPPQIDRNIKKVLKKIRQPWEIVKKKDHYFVKIGGKPLICIASNSSSPNEVWTKKTLHEIRRVCEKWPTATQEKKNAHHDRP